MFQASWPCVGFLCFIALLSIYCVISSGVRFIALVVVLRFIALVYDVRFIALVYDVRFIAFTNAARFIAFCIVVSSIFVVDVTIQY